MSSQIIPVEPFDYVVFGGTGDLAERKLLPALYHRQMEGQFTEPTRIIGASRASLSHDEYRKFASDALKEHLKAGEFNEAEVEKFTSRLYYVSVDAKSEQGWDDLKKLLEEGKDRTRAFYLAVGPAIFSDISEKIRDHKLITRNTRIVVEKPIGRDLASATELNDTIGKVFREEQIFRIDHYLGKETVQNLMALRFANALYEPLWNSAHIDHVQITVSEAVGLENRAGYYDKAGALRDMVQNHILQLLCFVAMEAPTSMDAEAVRDEKLKVLRALKPITASNVEQVTVRGQYRAGASSGGPVKGYLEELEGGVSNTETFVAIKAEISNWRWAGVPFYLRTGKRMAGRMSEIVITFKQIPHSIFDQSAGRISANQLMIRLQPNEGVKQSLMIKDPGPGGMRLRNVPLDMSFAEAFAVRNADAYERLLLDVIRNNQTLFVRRDEVEAAWQWIDPILKAWEATGQQVQGYTAGTWGPSQSIALIERDGRTWNDAI
ncbi:MULTISPECIES: glucose-6-phosphate dehydrogenase [Sinorhizobium]|jgi:glucose-6-phosphate 1-dehydrogenase|uniref:Glucose-6-phosphate 1-dehydrogenase n=3 Tax=Sinorhizobium TaxID=28105 RepID=A0A2J0Z8M2_RHIML|nr:MULTISPECIES: glucose-6-phosphate dehydrogenase [Sinorhizobium]PND18732.1 glucose-6-phosphate 1-dehydrogenase [Ensifer sp. MMN_5]GCA48619.1 glucose-6-phosphate 1-dehydrogenase [Sinorhizobium sp. KGO-5]MCG5484318.1 glucose-6-phosphate dehydrogenase [Sinorhizobium meliloti]PJR16880.1 glucose-6-phosphate 1-dehydrogenase [Sinorhizobium meliloti]PND27799.1 glucose-6-phosphate 1-dehydrogenase [Sinorhizobium sp. M4_45]